jgi:hypothetical protein
VTTGVDFRRIEYVRNAERWKLIDDICESENLEFYLVPRNPQDKSPENKIRNEQIFKRAYFAEITGYTVNGFLGLMFQKWPKLVIPAALDYIQKDITGEAVSVYQLAQQCAEEVIRNGRAGIWVDFPETMGEVSRQDIMDGRALATATLFKAREIINWRTTPDGAKLKLSMVVLATTEDRQKTDDPYSVEATQVRMELGLDEQGYYYSRKHVAAVDTQTFIAEDPQYPTDGAGSRLRFIPFQFIGAQNNSHDVDRAPMYAIARANVTHFNDSAIYQDSVFQVGQAQPWMSGLTQDHLELLSQNNMYIGSGRLIGVPPGEQFGFSQAEPNMLAKEAMDSMVAHMIGIGAMYIQPGSAVKTATQAEGDQRVQHSVLSLIAENVSEGITQVLAWVGQFMNTAEPVEFTISSDFVTPRADPQMLREMVAGFVSGAIPMGDYFRWMQKHQLADQEKTVEEFAEEVSRTDADE